MTRPVVRLLVAALLAAVAFASPGDARVYRASAGNPLAGHEWGVFKGGAEMAWPPYAAATGRTKRLLGKIALQPKAKWFGNWIPNDQIHDKVRDYIDNATGGDPDVLVHLTLFRMNPWEQEACERLPTAAEKRSYQEYVRQFAYAVGNTRAMVVVQPDGPFASCAPGGSDAHHELIRFTARTLAELPRTVAYIEAGTAEWNGYDPDRAVRLLVEDGVEHVRGFIFNVTHYESTESQIEYGAQVVAGLAARGIENKHFLVDTAENGRPFTGSWFREHHPGRKLHSAPPCRTKKQQRCVTLGIPPTTDVSNPLWGFSDRVNALADKHVDAFVWAGRPWLHHQTAPFDRARALLLARTTPYQ